MSDSTKNHTKNDTPKPRKKTGRKCTITHLVRSNFLKLLEQGNYRSTAAKVAGVTLDAINRFSKKDDKQAREFREEIIISESIAECKIVGAITKAAMAGDIRAAEFFLSRKHAERWSNNAELIREMNRILSRMQQRVDRGDNMDKPPRKKEIEV